MALSQDDVDGIIGWSKVIFNVATIVSSVGIMGMVSYSLATSSTRRRSDALAEHGVKTAKTAVDATEKLLSEVAKLVQGMAEQAATMPTAEQQIAAASSVDHAREVYGDTSDLASICETVGEIVAPLTTHRKNLREAVDFRKAPKARELDDALTATITRGEELQERLRRTIADHQLTAEELKKLGTT